MKNLMVLTGALLAIVASGCGSVSGICPCEPHTLAELSAYERVVVTDFQDEVAGKKATNLAAACRNFPDRVAAHIKERGGFADVSREQIPGRALVITGSITRYEEGNSFARLMVGCGVGSSYFDANVVFKDSESGVEIATMKVDKNSWVLGGGIAAGQNVETFMDEAAKKVAGELGKTKNGKKS